MLTCRRPARSNRSPVALVEPLEPRTLMSASHAVLVMQAPAAPAPAIQTDQNATSENGSGDASLDSAIDIRIRKVSGGIYLNVSASSTQVMTLAPTGTVDIYADLQYIATVPLGGAMRSMLVLPAGTHTFMATYHGDASFRPSQNSITTLLDAPTATPDANSTPDTFATNNSGERIRAMRLLSEINYFDAQQLTVGTGNLVGAIPTPPSDGTPIDPGTSGGSFVLKFPVITVPTPRFAKISFSIKMPKLSGAK